MRSLAPLACPQCRTRHLDRVRHDGVEIDACVGCGGLWFDRSELDRVVRAWDAGLARSDIAGTLGPKHGDTALACPRCRASLESFLFTEASPLVIDVCGQCEGIWLERGELPHAQAGHQLPDAMRLVDGRRNAGTWLFQFLSGLPVEFNIRPRRFPWIALGLVALNLGAFVALRLAPSAADVLDRWALFPAQRGTLHWAGTLFTHPFLHASWIHLTGNMYFAYILGDNLEDAFGRARFLGLYVLCGVAGGLAQSYLSATPDLPCIGASGAVAGLLGAFAVLFRRARLTFMFVVYQAKLTAFWYAAIWIGVNLLGALAHASNVAWFAHLAGFAAGAVVARLAYASVLEHQPLLSLLNRPAALRAR